MHLWEEWNWRWLMAICLRPQEPIIQPQAFGRRRSRSCSPMLLPAWESIAFNSGSDSGNATLLDRDRAAESLSPEPSSSPYAAIDILSSAGPHPVPGPSHLIQEHRRARSARRVRGQWRLTWWGNSHCYPQITLTTSWCSLLLLRDRETRMGNGKGDTPLFDEEVSGSQHCDGHIVTMRTWLIHERCFSILIAQARDTAFVTIRWSQAATTSTNTRAERHL